VASDTPGVLAPPPLFFAAAFAAGWFFRNRLPRLQSIVGGSALLLAAFALLAWGAVTMLRARTHIDPYQPATALVTTGPFRFTRNPLYVAFTLFFIGLALWTGWLSSLLLLPLAHAGLHYGVVAREERYLANKFGAAYDDYRRRVRRWL
jgi:protein-S-isoprenylcysteine O-methyltransferase Ste14